MSAERRSYRSLWRLRTYARPYGPGLAAMPLALLAVGLGVLEAVAVLVRRWVMTHSALGLETDVRRDLYAHLQLLPVAFHDRWQSGQLLTRAMAERRRRESR